MALRECVHLQNDGADADDLRRLTATLSGDSEGIIEDGDFAVTPKSGTPDMSVDIAIGRALILGTEESYQGTYYVESDAVENVAVAASDPTNPRKDLVVAWVRDSVYSGVNDDWILDVITGTPAGSPTEPAVPDNALVLALIDIPASATAIDNVTGGIITDRRDIWPGAIGGGPKCAVYRAIGGSGSQAVASGGSLNLTFDTILYTTDAAMVASNDRIITKKAGHWRFEGSVPWGNSQLTGIRRAWFKKNDLTQSGEDARNAQNNAGAYMICRPVCEIDMDVDDFVRLECRQTNDAAGVVYVMWRDETDPHIRATWLGPKRYS